MDKPSSSTRKSGEKKRGKKYRAVLEKCKRDMLYKIPEAINLLQETSITKFDSSVEVHIHLGINPKHADQMIRGTLSLAHGTGKSLKIIAFVSKEMEKDCKAAGAIEAGSEELVTKIDKGWLDFDIAIASPDQMKGLSKIAKNLGQKGLMPNPKAGTISTDPVKTIEEIQKGRIEYKADKEGNLHNLFGRISFGHEKLEENLRQYLKMVREAKPASVKGTYILSITVATSMGPGIKIDPTEIYA